MANKFVDVEVEETPLGRGVFAGTGFMACDIIGEVKGSLVDDADYESDYCMDLGNDSKLEPKPPFRFLNHSCEPNCELVLWKWRRSQGAKHRRLWLQAIRPVHTGDELTIDYAWPASAAIPCRCNSHTCRGWIVDPDQVKDVVS